MHYYCTGFLSESLGTQPFVHCRSPALLPKLQLSSRATTIHTSGVLSGGLSSCTAAENGLASRLIDPRPPNWSHLPGVANF